MKVLSFFGIKGGIAKTVSSLAFAQILHNDYSMRVLLIDIERFNLGRFADGKGRYYRNGDSSQ